MKKSKFLVLIIVILAVLLAGCNKMSLQTTDLSEVSSDNVSESVSESESVEVTDAPELPQGTSLFDASMFKDIEAPAVVDAVNFEQLEVFEGYDYEYLHKIVLPKIDSELPGALALNQKMSARELETINMLKTKTDVSYHLYTTTYTSSVYDGIISIQKNCHIGLFASEGTNYGEYYYYDSINDRELNAEEYLSHFGLNAEELDFIARWSNGYEYEESYADGLAYCRELLSKDESTYSNEMFDSGVSYAVAKGSNTPKGFVITPDTVSVYYSINGYVTFVRCCPIDVKTGLPKYPLFFSKCNPTGVLEGKTGIKIKFENKAPVEVLVSEDLPIKGDIIASNSYISVIYALVDDLAANAAKSKVLINGIGSDAQHGYSQGLIEKDGERMFEHSYRYPNETSLEGYETLEIIFEE